MMNEEEIVAKILSHGPQNGESDAKSVLAAFDEAILDGTVFGVEPFSMHRIHLQYDWLCRVRAALAKQVEAE